jgi:riboflavin biosynthesis pyrimidine reductase
VLSCLGKANITSLLVEGGSAIHGAFLRARLVDQAYLFLAPYFIGDAGTPLLTGNAPEIFLQDIVPEKSGKDILLYGLIQENSKR